MRQIPLGKGLFAKIDDQDYALVSQYKWYASMRPRGVYVYRSMKRQDGKWSSQYLHQLLMGVEGQGNQIDHIDNDGLNNCRDNLRLSNPSLNHMNTRKRLVGSSKYKGVYWHKSSSKWMARVDKTYVGSFLEEKDAAKTYNLKAREMYGEFALVNNV